jgi:hypothetical protein
VKANRTFALHRRWLFLSRLREFVSARELQKVSEVSDPAKASLCRDREDQKVEATQAFFVAQCCVGGFGDSVELLMRTGIR